MLRRAPLTRLATAAIAFYLCVVAVTGVAVLSKTGGTFVYALDDPYIHLAMAEQIAHGHYGINPGEAASPSSSLMWPLLLVPLSGTAWQVYLPLFWNLLAGVASAGLIGCFVEELHMKLLGWQKGLLAVLLVLVANLSTLTFIGMEHGLQVMLTICCGFGVVRAAHGRPVPFWCLAAAVVAPSVRYENLLITVAVGIALAGIKQTRKAVVVLALSSVPLILFGFFLKAQGLSVLPTSVLMKAGKYTLPNAPVMPPVQMLATNFFAAFTDYQRLVMVLLLAAVLCLSRLELVQGRRLVLCGAALVAFVQLLVGRFGWFYRYQVYALIFVSMIVTSFAIEQGFFKRASQRPELRFGVLAGILLVCCVPFLVGMVETPREAFEIYEQQEQMHRFVRDFYPHNIAVNDLGLVSYQRPKGVYVLDVYGLASAEVAGQEDKSADWLAAILERHDVHLAMVYSRWFDIPESWVRLGRLCRGEPKPLTGEQCTDFYSTSAVHYADERAAVVRFAATVPLPAKFEIDLEDGDLSAMIISSGVRRRASIR